VTYWEGPREASAGSLQDSWYQVGDRWVHVQEEVRTQIPNGGFELGVAGFSHNILGNETFADALKATVRDGITSTVAILENVRPDAASRLASGIISSGPHELYLQAGWMKSDGGNGFLGRNWSGTLDPDKRSYSYVVSGVQPGDWTHYAGVTQAPEGTTGLRLWLINFHSEGIVMFDNVLLIKLDQPGQIP
jgi:hypothetical protein